MHLFIHSEKRWLNDYYVPGIVLGFRDKAIKTRQSLNSAARDSPVGENRESNSYLIKYTIIVMISIRRGKNMMLGNMFFGKVSIVYH